MNPAGKPTRELASFFGAGGAGFSPADLAGVPLTGMNPLSPYLNVDPRYLVQVRDEFILPVELIKPGPDLTWPSLPSADVV